MVEEEGVLVVSCDATESEEDRVLDRKWRDSEVGQCMDRDMESNPRVESPIRRGELTDEVGSRGSKLIVNGVCGSNDALSATSSCATVMESENVAHHIGMEGL